MSKDKAIKKTKTPVSKSNTRKTPSKNSKKDLNANKTKTPIKSKSKTNSTPQKSSRGVTRNKDLIASKKVDKTKEMIDDKEGEKELIEETQDTNNMMIIQSQPEKEEENQLVEVSNENELEEEEKQDLNETIIPSETIENNIDNFEESQSMWSTIKSKLSNVLANLFSYIIPSKESESNNDDSNKFDPNITIIGPVELEELEKEEERSKEEELYEDIPIPKLPNNNININNNNNNMHILLNISNDNDEDSNGVILYQHIPENESQETTQETATEDSTQLTNNPETTQESTTPERTQESKEETIQETQEDNQEQHEKEPEKKKESVKLFNFQTTSTPSFYSNIEQPPNLRKRKRFQLNINKNKPNKPIQSENRYFKLKYIPYTTLLAVPSTKRIKTISIEKEEEISKSPKIIKPNIIESKQNNDLSFSSKTNSLQSRLNFDLTKDTKKILSTLDILTTPSKLYFQFNNSKEKENDLNNNNNNKNTKIDFSLINKDIEKRVSIVSEEVVKAVDYAKKRNSLPKYDSLNNSINNNTIEINSPSTTHDVIEYSFSSPTPSKIVIEESDISREFQFSDLNNDNDDDNEEFSFSQPMKVQKLPADNVTFIFSPAK